MPLTVCVLAAGRGSRLASVTGAAHKALAPVAYRAVLSRILTSYPPDTRFVIALGYRESLLREYLTIAHPDLSPTLVSIENFDRPGSGPGRSLLECRPHLNGPFVFTTCDTLVDEPVPPPAQNWIGVAPHPQVENFCSVGVGEDGRVERIDYRRPVPDNQVFIGIGGVASTDIFWSALETNQELVYGEHQIANGLAGLLAPGLKAVPFTWHDTGEDPGLLAANLHWRGDFTNFDKAGEFIFFEGGSVVKFFADSEIVRKRFERNRLLGDACPEVSAVSEHFYRYPYLDGECLSQRVDDVVFAQFMEWCLTHLWRPRPLSPDEAIDFRARCREFYLDKTRGRLAQFLAKTGVVDQAVKINGYEVASAAALLEHIDWDVMSQGLPVGFHGDLHFDNTLVPADPSVGQFKLLDWRHEFCGLMEYGDWHYDLAKIHHELIISHDEIKAGSFTVDEQPGVVRITHLIRSEYVSCQKVLERFTAAHGIDYRRVLTLTYIIFLNMAPLHHAPFDRFLYYLGRLGLHQVLIARHGRA